jgi:hypothetical protein
MAMSTLGAAFHWAWRRKEAALHIVSHHNRKMIFWHFPQRQRSPARQASMSAGFFEHKDYPLLWTALWIAV